MFIKIKLLIIVFAFCTINNFVKSACPDKNIVCYWESWSVYRTGLGLFKISNINPKLCTHLIYSFAGLSNDGVIKSLDQLNDINNGGYKKFVNLKKKNSCLKVLLGIGGWSEGSDKYSKMAKTNRSREKFANSVIRFMEKYKFDGLDMDWEYPAQRGGLVQDKENYISLLKTLKSKFKNKKFLLSAAVAASISISKKSYDIKEMCKTLDFVNLMAYDMQSSDKTSIQSPLKLESFDNNNTDIIDKVINYYKQQGCQLKKINLGIPAYGRSFTLMDTSKINVGAKVLGVGAKGPYTKEPGYLGYNEICEYQKNQKDWNKTLLKNNAAVYAWHNNLWVSYDDPKSIVIKGKYVLNKRLGGLMFWAIDTDDFRGVCTNIRYPLLKAAKKSLNI